MRQQFAQEGARSVKLFESPVAEALWNLDEELTFRSMEGLEQWDAFIFAQVVEDGQTFLVRSREDKGLPTAWSSRYPTLDLNKTDQMAFDGFVVFITPLAHGNRRDLGHLIIGFSTAPIDARVAAVETEAAWFATGGFSLMGILVFLIAQSVTRPLVQVTGLIESVARGETDIENMVARRSDEVGRLSKAVDVFRSNATRLVEVQAEAAAAQKIARMALTDHLTQLSNRRALEEAFSAVIDTPVATDLAVLQVDLDRFKQINDTLGHAAGDHVLCDVARRLMRAVGDAEMIARVGGDEFVVLLRTDGDPEHAQATAQGIVDALRAPSVYEGQACRVGCSVGVAYTSQEAPDPFEAMVNADIALYRAKENGKNQFAVFTDRHRQDVINRKSFADELFLAIERAEFVPYFQPQVDATTHRITGAEVLARWNHPTKGTLPPAAFIQTAEDLNLLRLIDREVFLKAADVFNAWQADGLDVPSLSINVSGRRLFDQDLRDDIASQLKGGLKINVELVESIYLDEAADEVLWALDDLRLLGVDIEIDDFGTGHSSVAGLLRVNPDRIKIDRQFVAPIIHSERERTLVSLFIRIAEALHVDVIAEGVETLEHAALLKEMGCDCLQGYAFSPPITAESFAALLKQDRTGTSLVG